MQVLSSMGLQAEVPLCSIKLSPPDAALLQINSDDLLHLPRTPQVRTYAHAWSSFNATCLALDFSIAALDVACVVLPVVSPVEIVAESIPR